MKIKITILFFALFAICTYGQFEHQASIDSIFKDWNKEESPGASLGIIQNGKLVYATGYGYGDLEHDLELTQSSVFYIGSVSKQFVTFSVLLLEEQGKLNLDDRIQKYLPDFPEYNSSLTIRHFIHHTSGVRDYLTLMALKGRSYLDHITLNEVYELIKSQKVLNFKPGEKYLYSNSCYFMLAMIIEKAAGKSLKEFAQEEIFGPLNMSSTLFYDDNTELIKNKVFSYEKGKEEGNYKNLIMRFDLVGSGGVYSSVEDLYKWDQNFYNNTLGKGGQAIIEKMHEEGLLNNGESSGYAFALNNGEYKELRTVSHGGSLAGYRAQLMRFPDEETSIIILANRNDANPTGRSFQVADVILKDRLTEEIELEQNENPVTNSSSSEFNNNQIVGNYEIQSGVLIKISLENDSLNVVQNWNKVSYKIVNTIGDVYQIPNDASIDFVFSELKDEKTQVLSIIQGGSTTACNRISEVKSSAVNLEDYIGSFYSQEIDATYRFYLENDVLKVKIPNNDPEIAEISNFDLFTVDGVVVRFIRESNAITGFQLDAGRVTNLDFKKR